MKVLFIVGSPRDKGCTSLIADRVIEGIGEGIEIRKYVLGNMRISYCLGCKRCSSIRECVQRDDMDILINDLHLSDIVIIAAPSYWGAVPGQLKVFFDRSLPLCDTNEGGTTTPGGKKGYSLAIRGGSKMEENEHLINSIEHYFVHLGIQPVKRITFERIYEVCDVVNNPEVELKAYQFGREIIAGMK